MKKIAFSVSFLMCLLFSGCKDEKVQKFGQQPVFVEQCDTSAVCRVKIHSFGASALHEGYIAIALDNGKRFSVKYHEADLTADWMLINEGDTLVYQGDKILSVIWKKR